MENNKDISKGINGLKALLIGMRNDNKELLTNLALMSEKIATKDNVRLQVVAEQDGVRDVKVTNQPEVQKVEITNLEKAPEVSKVEVINPTELPDTTKINNLGEVTEPVVAELKEVTKGVGFIPALIEKLFEGIKSIPKSVFKVEVTNPTKQLENIHIMNRQPSEAVPVVLVDRKGKNFYDAIFQAFTGGEVNLQRTNEKLDEVVAAIAGISVTVDMTSTNALITTTNTKLDTLDGRVDGIEALITTTNGYLDGVETAIASTNTKLDTVIGLQGGLDGTNSDGSVTLTAADTWKQVPPSGSVPDAAYTLIVSKETSTGTIRFSFDNGGVPSATNGNKFSNNDFVVELAANEAVYFGSTAATDVVNWTAKKLV